MTPIEQAHDWTLLFLECGCAGYRLRSHPTGAAFLVKVYQPCVEHRSETTSMWSIPKGELVSPFRFRERNVR
jgi:hypothetical protein